MLASAFPSGPCDPGRFLKAPPYDAISIGVFLCAPFCFFGVKLTRMRICALFCPVTYSGFSGDAALVLLLLQSLFEIIMAFHPYYEIERPPLRWFCLCFIHYKHLLVHTYS